MNIKEEILSGGALNQVVKIGNTVHRHIKGHPMLHSYLQFLEIVGMTGVPRFLGLDEQGREILTYLPGKTMGPDYPHYHQCLHSDETIIDMARFMRKLHDISAGFLPKAIEAGWENPYNPYEEYETICHGDASIWNFVFVDDRLAGLFDFDQAFPGKRVWDLTSTVFSAVGLGGHVYNSELKIHEEYNPSKHVGERKRKIKLFFDTYGIQCPVNFTQLMIQRIQEDCCDGLLRRAEAGDESSIRCVKRGFVEHHRKIMSHIKEYGHEWV